MTRIERVLYTGKTRTSGGRDGASRSPRAGRPDRHSK
jgi:hypothetical protein